MKQTELSKFFKTSHTSTNEHMPRASEASSSSNSSRSEAPSPSATNLSASASHADVLLHTPVTPRKTPTKLPDKKGKQPIHEKENDEDNFTDTENKATPAELFKKAERNIDRNPEKAKKQYSDALQGKHAYAGLRLAKMELSDALTDNDLKAVSNALDYVDKALHANKSTFSTDFWEDLKKILSDVQNHYNPLLEGEDYLSISYFWLGAARSIQKKKAIETLSLDSDLCLIALTQYAYYYKKSEKNKFPDRVKEELEQALDKVEFQEPSAIRTCYIMAFLLSKSDEHELAARFIKILWESNFKNEDLPQFSEKSKVSYIVFCNKINNHLLTSIQSKKDDITKEILQPIILSSENDVIPAYETYRQMLVEICERQNDTTILNEIQKTADNNPAISYDKGKTQCLELLKAPLKEFNLASLNTFMEKWQDALGLLKDAAERGHVDSICFLQALALENVQETENDEMTGVENKNKNNNNNFLRKFGVEIPPLQLHPLLAIRAFESQLEVLQTREKKIGKKAENFGLTFKGINLYNTIYVRSLFEKSANHLGMAYELAVQFFTGKIFDKNLFIAKRIFQEAIIEQQDDRARYYFAYLCFYGEGGKTDIESALNTLKYFETNEPAAYAEEIYYLLGECYHFKTLYFLETNNPESITPHVGDTSSHENDLSKSEEDDNSQISNLDNDKNETDSQENIELLGNDIVTLETLQEKSRIYFKKSATAKHPLALLSLFMMATREDEQAKNILVELYNNFETKSLFNKIDKRLLSSILTNVCSPEIAGKKLPQLEQETISQPNLKQLVRMIKEGQAYAACVLARKVLPLLENKSNFIDLLDNFNHLNARELDDFIEWIDFLNTLLQSLNHAPMKYLKTKLDDIALALANQSIDITLIFSPQQIQQAKQHLKFSLQVIHDETAILLRKNIPTEDNQKKEREALLAEYYPATELSYWSLLTSLAYELMRNNKESQQVITLLFLIRKVNESNYNEISKQLNSNESEKALAYINKLIAEKETASQNYFGENLSDDSDSDAEESRQASERTTTAPKAPARELYRHLEEAARKLLSEIDATDPSSKKSLDDKKNYKNMISKIHEELSKCIKKYPHVASDNETIRNDLATLNYYAQQGKMDEALQLITTKFYVVLIRGMHYPTNLWNTEQRRKLKKDVTSTKHPLQNLPVYSHAVYEHAGVTNFTDYSIYTQLKLEKSARLIAYLLDQLQHEKIFSPGELVDFTLPQRAFNNKKMQIHQIYTNDYEKFKRFLEIQSQLPKSVFRSITSIPFTSLGGIETSHPERYSFGNKYYPEQEHSRLRPQWNSEFRAQHPHSGFIYVAVNPIEDLAHAHYVIGENMKTEVFTLENVLPERETTFNGFVPKDRVKYVMNARFPSFHHQEYIKSFEHKYGISQKLYTELKEMLRKYPPHSSKRRLMTHLLGEYLSTYTMLFIWHNIDKERIHPDGGVQVYRDAYGGFSLHPTYEISPRPSGSSTREVQRRLFTNFLDNKRKRVEEESENLSNKLSNTGNSFTPGNVYQSAGRNRFLK